MISFINRSNALERPLERRKPESAPHEVSETSLAGRVAGQAGDWMAEHPVVCVSVGVALGVALGWLIKRR